MSPLARDLSALADRFARHEGEGLMLPPLAVGALAHVLRDLADRAAALEDTPAPPTATGDLPPGVVRLDTYRRAGAL